MNRSTFVGGPVAILIFVLAGVCVLVMPASQPTLAASSGECVTARVDAPFRLPDGLIYPAGPLTICDGGAYSPVDTFQRILVGGSAIGLFVSQRRSAAYRLKRQDESWLARSRSPLGGGPAAPVAAIVATAGTR